jgi:hypothetical protein
MISWGELRDSRKFKITPRSKDLTFSAIYGARSQVHIYIYSGYSMLVLKDAPLSGLKTNAIANRKDCSFQVVR